MDDVMDIVNDSTDEWKAAFEQAVARGLEEVGLAAEGHAKAICPVDTGRLRNSITHAQLDGTHEAVGTNVEYARYVELGTSRSAEKPFLRPAASEHASEYRAILHAAHFLPLGSTPGSPPHARGAPEMQRHAHMSLFDMPPRFSSTACSISSLAHLGFPMRVSSCRCRTGGGEMKQKIKIELTLRKVVAYLVIRRR